VSRNVFVSALVLICLATSPFCLGQSRDRDRQIEDAQLDIRLLKHVIDEQDRRIADLEKTVKALKTAVGDAENPAHDSRTRIGKPAIIPAWQIPFAWSRIKFGMSRVQVEEILGPPVSVDSVLDYQTLVYKGDLPGTGILSGTVRLTSDRVSQVNAPDF